VAHLRTQVFCAIAKLLNFGYYKVWFCHLAPKLPFKRKPLWGIWIRTKGLAWQKAGRIYIMGWGAVNRGNFPGGKYVRMIW